MEATAEVAQNLKAAAKIFEKHGDTIRAMISFRVNDKSTVDDIFQDFFLSLVHRPIPSDIQNIKGYLNRADKNDVLDAARQTKSYRTQNRKCAEQCMGRVKYDNPEDIVVQAEETQKLFGLIENQLPPREAEAIIQRYRYDQDISEAAEAMCVNRRSFSRYLCMGLKKIRQFAQEGELEPNILTLS